MRNSALRRRLLMFMVSLLTYSMTVVVFAEGQHRGHGNQGNQGNHEGDDDEQEGQSQHQNQPRTALMWINHLDLLPGDPSVSTIFNAVNSGVGGGLSGLIITSSTTGDTATGGGNKVVEKGLQVPPGFLITGVRVCYELTNARTFIDQVRLAQVQDPPGTALVRLDDGTHQVNPGPICIDSAATTVNPALGAVRLDLRVNFGDVSDRIVIRAVGLHLQTS